MFNKVTAVVLIVQDFEKCLSFYRDIIGLQVVQLEETFAAFKMQDQDFAILHVSEGAEEVKAEIAKPPSKGVNPILLCTRVENVDAAYDALKAKGVEITRPPVDQPWGIRAMYFRDPEGNIWEFAHQLAA